MDKESTAAVMQRAKQTEIEVRHESRSRSETKRASQYLNAIYVRHEPRTS